MSDLQSEIDPTFTRREKVVQRVGWVLIFALLIGALLGVFGNGPISSGSARESGDGFDLSLEYARIARADTDLQLVLTVDSQETAEELKVTLSGAILDRASIVGIAPQPETEALQGDAILYTWQVEDWPSPQVITFEYRAYNWRKLGGQLEVSAGETELGSLTFSQFLFP